MSNIRSFQNNKRKSAVDHSDSSNGVTKAKQIRLEEKNNKVVKDINVEGFAESRAVEIQALTEVVKRNGGNHMAFQKLPRHMRRRAMSHNIKRVPRRLHDAVRSELEKTKPPGKRPSRCYRRRPKNLLAEYERRKRKIGWLETHIWHAKRFKMVQRWNYKLPLHPNEKSIRACYRAVNKHCLMQDVSFESYIEIKGPQQRILQELSHLTSNKTGPTFASQMTLSGTREGRLTLYTYDGYPCSAIGPVTFLWQAVYPHDGIKALDNGSTLWICCHPSFYAQALEEVTKCFNKNTNFDSSAVQDNTCEEIRVVSLKDDLVKFRLYGPASNVVLSEVLQVADIENIEIKNEDNKENKEEPASSSISGSSTDAGADKQVGSLSLKDKDADVSAGFWWKDFYSSTASRSYFLQQSDCWMQVRKCNSPAEAPSNCLLALTVRDPRLLLPPKKTKVFNANREAAVGVLPPELFTAGLGVSPLWSAEIRQQVKVTKISEQRLNELKSKHTFPGCPLRLRDKESRIPVILIQRPGSSSVSSTSHLGYASGWDVLIPSGWAMAFWVALVYRGARVGGVREARSIALQAGSLCKPFDFPDSPAGREQLQTESEALQVRHDRRPPAKRPNYTKLGFQSPFAPQWSSLVNEWRIKTTTLLEKLHISEPTVESNKGGFYVLRDRKCLRLLNSTFTGNSGSVRSNNRVTKNGKGGENILKILSSDAWRQMTEQHLFALVPVLLSIRHRGVPKAFGHICLPTLEDFIKLEKDKSFGGPEEKKHIDPEAPVRKEERKVRLQLRKKKKRGKGSKNANIQSLPTSRDFKEPSRTAEETKNTKEPEADPNIKNEMNLRDARDVKLLGHNSRMVCGFVRNGDFDFGRGHGTGLGFCSLAALLHLLEQQGQRKTYLVLFRNPTSFQYRFASLSIVV
ncbi:unnamed protein product [Candidula unifasciata]|uniref:Uncharacterized protein n=1 Tax=Candidula unifasciata TaxID=100452 RepID=A0A8S3ZD45_9EUPU|nr:unnamed protein product [Candidula unifasciata]